MELEDLHINQGFKYNFGEDYETEITRTPKGVTGVSTLKNEPLIKEVKIKSIFPSRVEYIISFEVQFGENIATIPTPLSEFIKNVIE